MSLVLKKLDELLHSKLQSINKVNDQIIECCVTKMNDVEQRTVTRWSELKKELQDLEKELQDTETRLFNNFSLQNSLPETNTSSGVINHPRTDL